jgi:hypothetical protein
LILGASHRRAQMLALALAASLLELGPLVALLRKGEGVLALLLAGLAYQVGSATPRPVVLSARLPVTFLALLAAGLMFMTLVGSMPWLAALGSLSWALHSVRRNISANIAAELQLPTTAEKRIARVIGFILAALLPPLSWLIGVLVAIAAAVSAVSTTKIIPTTRSRGFGHPLEWTMLVHQTHYFTYAYAVPLLLAPASLGGFFFVGIWFALGWISYLSAELLWHRWPLRTVFIVGHSFLAIILMLMTAMSGVPWLILVLWMLSGFGGGTVYCLTVLHKREGIAHERLERAEDVGHLLGVALAAAGVYALNWSATTLPAIGSIWAICAAIVMIAIATASRCHNKSREQSTQRMGGDSANQ